MNAGQVIEIAQEWVETHGSQIPGFCGAHLMGGLNYTPRETPFPAFKDVDFNILVEDGQDWEVQDISYRGLILEFGTVGAEAYRTPEVVLADSRLASNFTVDSILSDPSGRLASLHTAVAQEYARRKWVIARCEDEKRQVLRALAELSRADSPIEAFFLATLFVMDLAGLVAIAGLRPPTHRRGLVLMKKLLNAWGRPDLLEGTLSLYGCAGFSRAQVESYLPDCSETFDRAVQVTRSPVPYGFKLRPFVRPYFVEGVREILEEGCHREAMLWTSAFLLIPNGAIQADAPEEEKSYYQAKVDRLVADMGWSDSRAIAARIQQAQSLADSAIHVADEILSHNPEISD